MEVDELIDKLVSEETAAPPSGPVATSHAGEVAKKRERLAAVIAGGQSQRYLGRALSLDQVDRLSEAEIIKLYARYEMLFGASIVKTLGHAVLTMYSDLAHHYRPKINPVSLTLDLESNPVVDLGLSAYSGSLFHRFGLFLTPIAIGLITIKHCKFGEDNHGGTISGDTANSEDDREKNLKNVLAGKASAEKRRQKEEEFLDVKQRLALLEEQKRKIHDELPQETPLEPAGPQTVTKEPPPSGVVEWYGDWTPWIFGGLGLAVVGYIFTTSRGKPQAKSVKLQSVPAAAKPQPTTAPDPFYME